MREFLDTIEDQLRRIASEGDDMVALDEESIKILKRLASENSANAPVISSKPSQEEEMRQKAKENFVDDVKPIEFVSHIEMASSKKEISKSKKLKVVTTDFKIAPIPPAKPFTLPSGDKKEQWEFLRELVINDPVCNEHLKPEKNVVFGVGNLDAKIFFCGEAPGADEEIQAEPFVGKAGQLLTKIIAAMGLSRDDVYIGNIMNWRPELPTSSGNRKPTLEEMQYCLPYLKAQIRIVKPQVVVALGSTAVDGLLGPDPRRRLGAMRGNWQTYEGTDLMVTYHPSYLLQYASEAIKRLVWEDMMSVMERVNIPISEKQKKYFLPKSQS